jgi:hypothetical protein
MTLRVELIPPEPTETTEVRFWGEIGEFDLLRHGLYALDGQRDVALAQGQPFLYTSKQLEDMRKAWTAFDTRQGQSVYTRVVPLQLAVAATRGVLLMHGEVEKTRHAWDLTHVNQGDDRHIQLSRIRSGLEPLIEHFIEPGEQPPSTPPSQE